MKIICETYATAALIILGVSQGIAADENSKNQITNINMSRGEENSHREVEFKTAGIKNNGAIEYDFDLDPSGFVLSPNYQCSQQLIDDRPPFTSAILSIRYLNDAENRIDGLKRIEFPDGEHIEKPYF